MEDEFLTEQQVSEMTKIALSTLRNHRSRKLGMPYHKVGRSIRYSARDVKQYMDRGRIETERRSL